MRVNVIVLGLCAFILCPPTIAAAQEGGQVGIAMGFPASFDLVWHVTDRVAIRPDFGFSTTSSESSSEPVTTLPGFIMPVSVTTSDSRSFGFGVSALFYVHRVDNLRVYVSPRVAWSDLHATSEGTITGLPGGTTTPLRTETDGSAISVSGSFGAQYSLHRRFGVFGEIGIVYTDQETSGSSSASRGTLTVPWCRDTERGGVIFYF